MRLVCVCVFVCLRVCVSDVKRREREMETREREMETLTAKLVNSNATIDTLQQGPKNKLKEKEEK
jgi:cell division protein FtsB